MSNNSSSMRTDISKVRHLGSARSGTSHAWKMRVTSAALILLTIAFVWLCLSLIGRSYEEVMNLFGQRVMPGAIALLFVLVGCYHMMLGMRTIVEDYVHGALAKEYALIANVLFCGLVAGATALAIIKLAL
jgi:succinate dehydrogenase / fumarate reductase membrane anchor subunit